MGSSALKQSTLLTFLGTSSLLMVLTQSWTYAQSWRINYRLWLTMWSASISFKSMDEEDHHNYLMMFDGYPEGKGFWLILGLSWGRERRRVTCRGLTGDSSYDPNQPTIRCFVSEDDGALGGDQEDVSSWVKKAMTCSRLVSLKRHH